MFGGKLGANIKSQFKKKLSERLDNPHIPSAALSGMKNCYKIKLRVAGYRLVYRVEDERITVVVVAFGKREGGGVYDSARGRI